MNTIQYLKSLVEKYKGSLASDYDMLREANPKWAFEDSSLNTSLTKIINSIHTVLDIPVGTGRTFNVLNKQPKLKVTGVDLSEDMLAEAAKKINNSNTTLILGNIFEDKYNEKWDLVICYRFLNLVNWELAQTAFDKLLDYSNKYFLFTIRTVPRNYKSELFIEDKIYLHYYDQIVETIKKKHFSVSSEFSFPDERQGDYKVILCERNNQIKSCRLNKNLRFIYDYGTYNENLGKIYEVQNTEHAQFIKYVSTDSELRHLFPRIYSINNNFINAEWIEGNMLESKEWVKVVELLKMIQSTKILINSSFDYVADLVIPRFLKSAPLIGEELCTEILNIIKKESERYEAKLSHPDLIPGNVLITKNGLVVIDNELLCNSIHYRIDILNMLHNLPESQRNLIVQSYFNYEKINKETFQEEKEYLSALWFARQTGSLLIRGKIDEIIQLNIQYRNKQNILPFDFFK